MAGSKKGIKKANRKATKGVRRLWKKGQSSSYNPTFNKFRLEAKKDAFGNKGNSILTEAKLAEHNKKFSSELSDDDQMSIGGDTNITAFTNCSLPTFSRLVNNWNAGSLLHKEMIAVLAAVSDVIKKNGGKETETEYFAALMTTLDIVDTDEGVTAVICLMSMVIKKLSENVLKVHCDKFCDTFMKLLLKYMNSDHGALLRNLLKIVYTLLKVKINWSESTCERFKVLLEFIVHHKPKVRRAAHQIVRSLMVDCTPECGRIHPGCSIVTDFCISKLENSGGLKASKDVFYILSLLEETLAVFPKSSVKLLCETILRVMTLSNSMVTSVCLRTLKGLFAMEPKPENLPTDLNARIITALYDYQPNVRECQTLINWLQLMEAAFINLIKLDAKLCVAHLPKFYNTAVKCWQNEREEVLEVVTSVLKTLLYECIKPSQEVFQKYLLEDAVNNPMHKMFHSVEECLSYQYHKAWKYVLIMLAAFFEVMGKYCYTVMFKCLQSLADLHDSYKFSHIFELEKAVGTAIQHMGPKIVLQAIPLETNGNSDKPDFPRSWLLPLLRDYIKKTELQFFVRYFIPLAAKLRQKSLALQQEQKIVESKLYEVICSQIWSLLPGFCTEPTDLIQCFREVARTLGTLLNEEPSLIMTVLSSLRVLVKKNLENEENRAELSKYCKNYLPILFNLYSTEPKDKSEEKVRLAVYETCKVFLQITEKSLCKTFFDKALEKLLSPETNGFLQQSMIDVCRAILPYVDASEIEKIYEYCKPLLKDANHTIQKKAYSVLNEICSSESNSCKLFVKEHLEDIRPLLCGVVSGLNPSTRALRLNILAYLTTHLSIEERDFVKSIIPEAILCTKENSVKARAAAYNLLIVIGNTILKWQPDDDKGFSSHGSASYGTNNSGYSNQQGVYSGSGATTSQSGTMMSTSVSSSKLTNSLAHSVKDSSLLESQHNSSQHTYEVTSTTSSSSVLNASSLASTSSTNHSVQNSSNMNSVLGLVSTSSSTTTTSVLKNSLSASALREYLKLLLAGLAGSPHLMSATILAIGRVVYEFKDKIDSSLIHLLIENTCLLLTSKSREVVVSAISFLKILFTVMNTEDLAEHVEFMVKSITSISEENQRHFRFKAKELFTRLIRKFGYEMISKLVPESYQKQITHIRKMESRKARKTPGDVDENDLEYQSENKVSNEFDAILADSDEEMPLETDTEKQTKTSKRKKKNIETIIEEDGEDDIIDLLDPSVNKRLITKNPEIPLVRKKEKSFPVSEDGRLIITEDDNSHLKQKNDKQSNERREILSELGALFKNKNKRKYQESEDGDDDEGGLTVSKGIHRTLESKSKKRAPGSEFKAKKAGGDVKKGKYDPYAYVPLNRQMLNKRKQVKVKGQFKSIVKGAKKGATIGVKRKMRDARKRKNK